MTIKAKHTVDILIWASVNVIVLRGAILFLVSKKN